MKYRIIWEDNAGDTGEWMVYLSEKVALALVDVLNQISSVRHYRAEPVTLRKGLK